MTSFLLNPHFTHKILHFRVISNLSVTVTSFSDQVNTLVYFLILALQ